MSDDDYRMRVAFTRQCCSRCGACHIPNDEWNPECPACISLAQVIADRANNDRLKGSIRRTVVGYLTPPHSPTVTSI